MSTPMAERIVMECTTTREKLWLAANGTACKPERMNRMMTTLYNIHKMSRNEIKHYQPNENETYFDGFGG